MQVSALNLAGSCIVLPSCKGTVREPSNPVVVLTPCWPQHTEAHSPESRIVACLAPGH